MGKTKIEWTKYSHNFTSGCSRLSPGCMNCYAEDIAYRFSKPGLEYEGLITRSGQWNGVMRLNENRLLEPLRWRKPRTVFVNSMSDLFHENLPDEYIDKIFAVMALCPQHVFQVLTKRADRMQKYLSDPNRLEAISLEAVELDWERTALLPDPFEWPLQNVWLGVSVESQQYADERIPALLSTPAAIRWISAEPLLNGINIGCSGKHHGVGTPDCPKKLHHHHDLRCYARGLNWVVVGAESGHGARPFEIEWARSLRDQCQTANVKFFMKQITDRRGKKIPYDQFPEDLQIREYPGELPGM